jgi:hypothetical protein
MAIEIGNPQWNPDAATNVLHAREGNHAYQPPPPYHQKGDEKKRKPGTDWETTTRTRYLIPNSPVSITITSDEHHTYYQIHEPKLSLAQKTNLKALRTTLSAHLIDKTIYQRFFADFDREMHAYIIQQIP